MTTSPRDLIFADMTDEDRTALIEIMCKGFRQVCPKDCQFLIILHCPNHGSVEHPGASGGSLPLGERPSILRDIISDYEATLSSRN